MENFPNDEDLGSLIFGSKGIHYIFNSLLKKYRTIGIIEVEEYNEIGEIVNKMCNEMWYSLQQSSLFNKLILNTPIIWDYREKLRQHSIVGKYIKIAESYQLLRTRR
mgnify:FL=1